jgi:biopolymer transport protein ExbD
MPKRRRKRSRIVFEVIPVIDVMMVLCLFFAIAAFLPQVQNIIDTKLPKAASDEKAKEALVVTLNSFGNIYIQDKLVSKNELIAELKLKIKGDTSVPLLLAADSSLKYDKVVNVLDIMRRSGAAQIGLVTQED